MAHNPLAFSEALAPAQTCPEPLIIFLFTLVITFRLKWAFYLVTQLLLHSLSFRKTALKKQTKIESHPDDFFKYSMRHTGEKEL